MLMLSVVTQSVKIKSFMLNVFKHNVIMLNVFKQNVIMLNVFKQNVIMLNVFKQNVILLNVILLIVVAPICSAWVVTNNDKYNI
jgi:hypothetical protein